MREQFGKYCLDLSKLIFGGVVIAAIMKQDVNFWSLVVFGGSAAALSALCGFYILKPIKSK